MVSGANNVLWAIEVNGVEITRVKPGESVVIGRKPIRMTIETEADRRVDIDDPNKSMSKRHAKLSVDEYGRASFEDIGSMNGSFTVQDDGALMKLPANTKVTLRRSPVHLQLGDLIVDLREVTGDGTGEHPVQGLFDGISPAELADVANGAMSVDQILDVRAGEPTSAVDSNAVKRPASTVKPIEKIESRGWAAAEEARRRDEAQAAQNAPATPVVNTVDTTLRDKPAAPAAVTPAAARPADTPTREPEDDNSRFAPQANTTAARPTDTPLSTTGSASTFGTSATNPHYDDGSMLDRMARGQMEPDASATTSAAPDPDDRVISGYTVREVRTTSDYQKQFDMARHGDLMAILAMNPHLYGDLYTWFEQMDNADVKAALASNSGYQEWKRGK